MRTQRYVPMRSILLRTVATAGVLSVALVAPQALRLIKGFDRAAARRKNAYRNIQLALWRLERAGLIRTGGLHGRRSVRLTQKGRDKVGNLFAAEYRIPEPAFWDGKWRMVMFDMKERRKKARNALRTLLRNAGFVRLQDSVWVYPYPCDEFIELVRAHLKSGVGEFQYVIAEALESDLKLREHFRLI